MSFLPHIALGGLLLLCAAGPARAQSETPHEILVAASGVGAYRSIQAALDALDAGDRSPVVIYVRNGYYPEKVFLRRNNISIVGEDRDSTRIVYPVLRDEWRLDPEHSDWGAGVVNIDSTVSDITLANLTIYNNHGSLFGTYNKHQFAVMGWGTRIILLHCAVLSDGGDALSLWNREVGMYYHNDCIFEGWVDYVCPRGWCYATDCRFFGHNTSAASIWHDGEADRRQKFVIANSFFDGRSGFPLGRHHRDGQIFMLNCRFSANMADTPIYRPASSPRPWKWGARHYFSGCRREGGNFPWFTDNLQQAEGKPTPELITARWTFDGLWDPESHLPSLLPFAFLPSPANKAVRVAHGKVKCSWVAGRRARSHRVFFGEKEPPPFAAEVKTPEFVPAGLKRGTNYSWRVDEVTDSGVVAGFVWTFTTK